VTLKLIYLVVRCALSWLRLSRRDSTSKNVEILMLRHQLAVAQRTMSPRELQRKLTWADRAWLTLLAGLLSRARLARLRLIVTPGTLLRWHRDLLGAVALAGRWQGRISR
jgi:hypothetical protein